MIYESILESLVYYSPKFRDIIKKIDSPISKELLNSEGDHILPDITFIDIDDDGTVTFSTMNNSIKKVSDFFLTEDSIHILSQTIKFRMGINPSISSSVTI